MGRLAFLGQRAVIGTGPAVFVGNIVTINKSSSGPEGKLGDLFISMGAAAVLIVLTRMVLERGKPKFIRVDNGPEFISKELSAWCIRNGITLKFIQPGKPMQNAYIERFNRSYRASVLDAQIFSSLGDVQSLSAAFIEEYNNGRPHESLGNKSPITYRLSKQDA